jgi:hypothetical protein
MTCCVSGDNHSKDLLTVYTGEESPEIICGFHYRRYVLAGAK